MGFLTEMVDSEYCDVLSLKVCGPTMRRLFLVTVFGECCVDSCSAVQVARQTYFS